VRGNTASAELSFPPHLYTPVVLQGFGHAFRASLDAARARGSVVELTEHSGERARWTLSWS
jgi:hypothetical protein